MIHPRSLRSHVRNQQSWTGRRDRYANNRGGRIIRHPASNTRDREFLAKRMRRGHARHRKRYNRGSGAPLG